MHGQTSCRHAISLLCDAAVPCLESLQVHEGEAASRRR